MSWIILVIAGLLEVVWAVGLKYTHGFSRLVPSVITIVAMGCFYNLNEKMYVRIVAEIEQRKQTA
mgnify:FL=1